MEAILVTIGLAAAALGILGYQSIRDEAVRQAAKKAEEQAVVYLKNLGKSDLLKESPGNGSNQREMKTRDEEEDKK